MCVCVSDSILKKENLLLQTVCVLVCDSKEGSGLMQQKRVNGSVLRGNM